MNRIVCLIPLPLLLATVAACLAITIYGTPHSPARLKSLEGLLGILMGVMCGMFTGLAIEGFKGIRLPFCKHRTEHYLEETQDRIVEIKRKFPKLEAFNRDQAIGHASEHLLRLHNVGFSLEELRVRLRKMSDEKLRDFETAMRHMVSPEAKGKESMLVYDVQLYEIVSERSRRHPEPEDRK